MQWPTWYGLVYVPKLAFIPEAMEAAIAIAVAVLSTSKFCNRAFAATAPKIPRVVVGCHPFS